jgi:hypothetical protein
MGKDYYYPVPLISRAVMKVGGEEFGDLMRRGLLIGSWRC